MSHVPTIRINIYFLNILNSLGNYIFINIYYSPRILRGEIYRYKPYIRYTVRQDCNCEGTLQAGGYKA